MTLKELNTYFELVNRLNKANEMLENLRAAASPSSPILTGMPHASGVKDKVGDLAAEIADLEARIKYYYQERDAHKEMVERFVSKIDDMFLKTIFRLRFERGLSWKEVASILGGGNSENSVKSACYRYLGKL